MGEARTGTVHVPGLLRPKNITALFGLVTAVCVLSECQSGICTWHSDLGRL